MLYLGPFSGAILRADSPAQAPHVTLERRRRGEQVLIIPSFVVETGLGTRRYEGIPCNEGPPGPPPYVTWEVARKWAAGLAAEHGAPLRLIDELAG
ncbi:MAG TPA: hypothetical protein VED40_17240 [Azospirillaceae bacterium]|nr:hypothetical protein [Azospirillaceae bacterium]